MFAFSACTNNIPAASQGKADRLAAMEVEERARVPGEYLVSLAIDTSVDAIADRYGQLGIKEVDALGDEVYLLVLANDPGPREMARLIYDDFRFRMVQPNIIYWVNRPVRKTD
jgi:hypothetical protein